MARLGIFVRLLIIAALVGAIGLSYTLMRRSSSIGVAKSGPAAEDAAAMAAAASSADDGDGDGDGDGDTVDAVPLSTRTWRARNAARDGLAFDQQAYGRPTRATASPSIATTRRPAMDADGLDCAAQPDLPECLVAAELANDREALKPADAAGAASAEAAAGTAAAEIMPPWATDEDGVPFPQGQMLQFQAVRYQLAAVTPLCHAHETLVGVGTFAGRRIASASNVCFDPAAAWAGAAGNQTDGWIYFLSRSGGTGACHEAAPCGRLQPWLDTANAKCSPPASIATALAMLSRHGDGGGRVLDRVPADAHVVWHRGTTFVPSMDGDIGRYSRVAAPLAVTVAGLLAAGLPVDQLLLYGQHSAWTEAVAAASVPGVPVRYLDATDAAPAPDRAATLHCFEHILTMPATEDVGRHSDYTYLRMRMAAALAPAGLLLPRALRDAFSGGPSGSTAWLPSPPSPAQPLRVTVVDRPGPGHVFNVDEVVTAITGALPDVAVALVRWDAETELDAAPAQIRTALAETDILVGAHDAALGSLVLLPPWAGVVELLHYFSVADEFSVLARGRALRYLAVRAGQRGRAVALHPDGPDCLSEWQDERGVTTAEDCGAISACAACPVTRYQLLADADAVVAALRKMAAAVRKAALPRPPRYLIKRTIN